MSEFDTSTTAVADITGDYAIDPSHSSLAFTARHAMVTKVRGQFRDFTGTAIIDTAEPRTPRSTSASTWPASTPATRTATVT